MHNSFINSRIDTKPHTERQATLSTAAGCGAKITPTPATSPRAEPQNRLTINLAPKHDNLSRTYRYELVAFYIYIGRLVKCLIMKKWFFLATRRTAT